MKESLISALLLLALAGCSDRHCTDPGICWATKSEIVAAAKRCGAPNFKPMKAGEVYAAVEQGKGPAQTTLTSCIVKDLKGQGLMVTH